MRSTFQLESLLTAAVFVGARVSGLMVFCPFLGSAAIPRPLKAALALLITALVYPLQGPLQLNLGSWQWLLVIASEVVIGLMLGLAANFMLEAPMTAGQILGVQMGYSLATVFDPQNQADSPVLAELHRTGALLIFLQLNVHHWMLRAVVNSFRYLPPAVMGGTLADINLLYRAAGGIFLTGLQLAAPALIATLLVDVALGFLGKASPQLPILFLGLSLKNLLGLVILAGTVAFWPESISKQFRQAVSLGEGLLHLAR